VARLTRPDRLLLWTLLPLFAVCLGLHVREIHRSGLALPGVFATPGGADGYPVVGGVKLERGEGEAALRVGDRLLQIGDVDLRGAGYLSFDAIALEQAGATLSAPLRFERDGVVRSTELPMRGYELPWYRVPVMLASVLIATVVLLRAPRGQPQARDAQLFFAALTTFAIVETPFLGESRLQSYAYLFLFHALGPVAIALVLLWALRFPREVPAARRLSPAWAWLALLFLMVRIPYFLGGPVPSHWVPSFVLSSDIFFLALLLGIFTHNYRHADPVGRRRMRWVILGAYLGGLPLVLTLLARVLPVAWEPGTLRGVFQVAIVCSALLPLGVLVAIVRYDLFDIDRLVSAAAAYSAAIVAGIVAAALLLPELAARLAARADLAPQTAFLGLAVVLAAVGIPVGTRLRPRIERVFFPERQALARGLAQLRADVAACITTAEVQELVAERLAALLRLERCVLFASAARGSAGGARAAPGAGAELPGPAGGGELAPRALAGQVETEGRLGRAPARALARRDPLARALEHDPIPLRADAATLRRTVPDASARDHAALASVGAEVLLPLRSGKDLAAVVALGPKRSGDVFTAEELAHLQAVGEKASAELSRLRAEATLRVERGRADLLHQEKEAAERANAARARFLAAASHDLRQPLHALGLFVERLAARPEAADEVLVGRIADSTRALTDMFDSLLDLSRLEAGVVEAEVASFALRPLLGRLAAEFEALACARGLALCVELPEALAEVRVASDPLLLARIVQNLLANAVRYTQKGRVVLRCRRDGSGAGGRVWIEVEDTGPGIPEEARGEIFREFVRLVPEGGERGLGLGLSIVERTARLLGHAFELDSEPGRGSTFRVSVPLARAEAARAQPAAAGSDALAGRVILVVDDDPAVREATHGLLEAWGCAALLADSLASARESLARRGTAPDAVVADHRLRDGETGVEVVRALRADWGARIPAVLVSGESDPARLRALRESGLPWLRKPLHPAKLRALLQELLR
jgi:signal transduction histidine kinase/CheY-like chemotaxis protein